MKPQVYNHQQYTDLEADYMILKAENEQLKARLDMAVSDIMCGDHCDVCLHKDSGTSCERVGFNCGDCDDPVCVCRCCRDEDKWQWRGPQKAGEEIE